MNTFITLGGRVRCNQCQGTSKRSLAQCRAPAMKGKAVCRTHGGLSTGPRTEAGRQRCAQAKTVRGRETRAIRKARSQALAHLAELESLGRALGLIVGSKTRGRQPLSQLTNDVTDSGLRLLP
jgi:hypothetical protein